MCIGSFARATLGATSIAAEIFSTAGQLQAIGPRGVDPLRIINLTRTAYSPPEMISLKLLTKSESVLGKFESGVTVPPPKRPRFGPQNCWYGWWPGAARPPVGRRDPPSRIPEAASVRPSGPKDAALGVLRRSASSGLNSAGRGRGGFIGALTFVSGPTDLPERMTRPAPQGRGRTGGRASPTRALRVVPARPVRISPSSVTRSDC